MKLSSKADIPKIHKINEIFFNIILIITFSILIIVSKSYLKRNPYTKYYLNYLNDCNKCFDNLEAHKSSLTDYPTYAIYVENPESGEYFLKHVKDVLSLIGLKRVDTDENWDLLWGFSSPFGNFNLRNLPSYKKVNHFPGNGHLISKVELSTSGLPYLPEAFRLPEDKEKFLAFQKENPQTLFVEKQNSHRNIRIKPIEQINLDYSNNTFIQEYLEKPYLIDGYKFDIGVYTIITSMSPLRVYIYAADASLRFCLEKYYPFNLENVKQYIVMGTYRPLWEVPSLNEFYQNYKFGGTGSLNSYMKSINQDPEIIWRQIEHIIRETILAQQSKILEITNTYNIWNLFEMMRFDLVVDENFKVSLMEANMSPNLFLHYKQSIVYFRQIIYNVLQLTGIATPLKQNNFKKSDVDTESMISSEKNLAVHPEKCLENKCHENCDNSDECVLCLSCLGSNDLEVLREAYREHIHRADNRRIFPKPILNLTEYDLNTEIEKLNPEDQMITKWFYEKCRMDSTWCK